MCTNVIAQPPWGTCKIRFPLGAQQATLTEALTSAWEAFSFSLSESMMVLKGSSGKGEAGPIVTPGTSQPSLAFPSPNSPHGRKTQFQPGCLGELGPQTLVFPTFPARQKRHVRLVGMAGGFSHTFRDGGSEVVPSQEAAGISEGWGAGASGLAAGSLRDVAVAVVIAVIRRAGMALAD